MDRTTLRGIGLATIAVAGTAAFAAPGAQAHDVAFLKGSTTLKPSNALKDEGIRATGITSKLKPGGVYSLHELDDGGGGTLLHRGTLTLRKGGTAIKLSSLTIRVRSATKKRKASGTLSAVHGGKRITIGRLELKKYKEAESPAGFTGAGVLLTAATARTLDRAFDTTTFAAGDRIGTLSATGLAAPLAITGGSTTIALEPAAARLLASRGASLTAAAGTAGTGAAASPFTFPITKSAFDYASFKGAIAHTGGLVYTAPAGRTVGGRPSLAFDGFRAQYTDALRLISSSGTPAFELRFEDKSGLKQSPRLTLSDLSVFFTKQAAAVVAPSLGIPAAQLEKTRLGTATTRATYRAG